MSELVSIIWANSYCVFIDGTPYAKKTLLPHVKRVDRFHYLIGESEPNFPLPAIPLEVGVTVCKGLIGECINCIWPDCEAQAPR